MKMNRINYYFKPRDVESIAYELKAICDGIAYNEIDKNKALLSYNLIDVNNLKLSNILESVQTVIDVNYDNIKYKCERLQEQWEGYKDKYFEYLENVLNIKIDEARISNYYCYLHYLPINEINLENNSIFLDCNHEEIFKTFIVMLTKLIIANIWCDKNDWAFSIEFETKNKLWMFIEIAVDSIFAHSNLRQICDYPSYKYFYSIKIDGVNIMEKFRILFTKISLLDFLEEVYLFVREHYTEILKFKNYLY